jgi:hypothetical protein
MGILWPTNPQVLFTSISRNEESFIVWKQYMQPRTFVGKFLLLWSACCRSWKIWTKLCMQRNYFSWNLHSLMWGICYLDALLLIFLGCVKCLFNVHHSVIEHWWMCCTWLFNTLLVSRNSCFYWVHRRLIFIVHAAVITVHSNIWLCFCKPVNILCFSLVVSFSIKCCNTV